jgi:formyltetrahydrofolate deformylase
MSKLPPSAILLIACPDRSGLVASVTEFIFKRGGNILYLDQHVDSERNIFFMRVEWDLSAFSLPDEAIAPAFQPLAEQFNMDWRLHFSQIPLSLAVFVSKENHCLYDLLARWQAGELRIEIPAIFSNHRDLEPIAEQFKLPFHHFPITKETKPAQEAAQLRLLQELGADGIILARYMQILSADFIAAYPNRIINIHHSFLPAFVGAKPYHQAFERGVKIIGATSHYVTAELDAGPIIEQDVVRVSHKDTVADMVRKLSLIHI